jgi:ureidoacrylate peracid hydrolase
MGRRVPRGIRAAPGEIVAQEHWCSSCFANTDLDLQLKKHGIHQLIVIGLIAHTCIEATVRYAAELGYDVTVVRDATADYSDEMMHAALDINLPNYATPIVTAAVDSLMKLVGALQRAGIELLAEGVLSAEGCRGVRLTKASPARGKAPRRA